MIAPELLISKALADLLAAKGQRQMMERLSTVNEAPWTFTHTLFANMGGFVVKSNHSSEKAVAQQASKPQTGTGPANVVDTLNILPENGEPCLRTSSTHREPHTSKIAVMQSPVHGLSQERASQLQALKYPTSFSLTAPMIIALGQGCFLQLPPITTDDIEDKSKSDMFVKAVAVVQIAWMVVQVIAREIRRLAVSQLEIAVVAFSACAIIIYVLS